MDLDLGTLLAVQSFVQEFAHNSERNIYPAKRTSAVSLLKMKNRLSQKKNFYELPVSLDFTKIVNYKMLYKLNVLHVLTFVGHTSLKTNIFVKFVAYLG